MPARVLVTGVRAKTGAPLAEILLAEGVAVRGGSSDPATVDADGVEPVAFSWDDPGGWPVALDGVDAVFVVRPDRPDAPDLVGRLAAATAPGTRVVLLSDLNVLADGPDGWSARTEAAVTTSGRPWTLLRPGWFMQVLTDPRFYRDDVAAGTLPYPAGGGRLSWIDARDIAAVAARALVDDGHDGRAYPLTGPEALTLPETAAALSEALGHPVVHRDLAPEEAAAGYTGFERDLAVATYELVAADHFAVVETGVRDVTGREPRRLEEFLADAFG
ncbi:NAD(P)H-binding protein [Nocardioides marinquilinus]|uniref:NAD(P)H-binding protein n=1 Tax=Nocardioides marinquilinus TaxID=1210400 RepID=A0ABP9P5A9_9ACTN